MKPSLFLRPLLASSLLLASATSLAEAAVETAAETRLDLGYDSNPYNLSDGVGEEGGMFVALDASAEATRKTGGGGELGVDAGAAARLFGSSMSDANEAQYFARVGGETGGKRRDHVFEWALRYRLRDSTYVSRSTGDVATSGGTEIGGRYDAGIADLRGAWRLPGARWGRVSLEGSAESKDYREDYASLGLDRLDYAQFGVEPQYEYERGANTVQVRLPWALRQYRDRRVSDATGVAVAGSDLEYTYLGLETRYARELSDADAIDFRGGYETREDNGVGYGDRKRWQAGTEWTHRPAKGEKLSAGVEYSSRVFDRPVTGNPLINDETPEKKGYAVKVEYERPFPGVALPDLALLGAARWESYDNSSDPIFEYDRYELFAGVRKEF